MDNEEKTKTCKNCKYWEEHSIHLVMDDNVVGRTETRSHYGCCEYRKKIIDCSRETYIDVIIKSESKDELLYSDEEGYAANLITGENFSCIHCDVPEQKQATYPY